MRILIGGADEAAAARADRLDVRVVQGAMNSVEALRRAAAGEADMFVASGARDEVNLVACLTASRLGARRCVCILYRPDFAPGEAEESSIALALGIEAVVRPTQLLAEEILRIVTVPGALDVEAFVGGRVQLYRHEIEEGAPIARGPLKDLGVPEGVVLVMARRGDEAFMPRGDTCLAPGDKLTVMGSIEGIQRLMRDYLRGRDRSSSPRRATVVGGGQVGFAVAQGLERAGWAVRVIEAHRPRCEEIGPHLRGLVLHGDGTDLDLLESERVGDDPVLVAVTSNDEKNLLVSLLAKQLGVGRIVTRADSLANERLFEKVGVDVVRSARGAAVQSVLRSLGQTRRELLVELEHGDAEVLELTLPEDLGAVPLRQMKADVFAIIGAILRGGQVIIPRGHTPVQGGDRILVFCRRAEEDLVREFFLNRIQRLAPRPEA